MSTGSSQSAGSSKESTSSQPRTGTARVKRGMAEMLKGGVIMDVVTAEQAKVAEDAGAVAVMALERVPADIRRDGGVARMSDPDMIDAIVAAVSIPVMAKARIGHFVEAQVLQSLGVDYVDESEVLTPADEAHHIDKWAFTVPFVCGATNLGEALRRIAEGAAMIRSKGEAGTGNVVEATRHMRQIRTEIRRLATLDEPELYAAAKEHRAPYELVKRGGRDRPAAGRAVHRRRHRHPRRRGDDDAAWGRGCLRRLGHLQVRQPRAARRGDRQGHHVLRRPGRHRQGFPRPGPGHGRDQHRRPAGDRAVRRPGLVSAPLVGVLALQGDVREHLAALERAGARGIGVRRPAELEGIDGLVLPGGESTTMSKLAVTFGLLEPLRAFVRGGLPAYGSCAGMIMLADRILDGRPDQETIGGIDMTVRRNAFGRQVDSFEADLEMTGLEVEAPDPRDGPTRTGPLHAVFIRAPWVESVGPAVQVLATAPAAAGPDRIVAVRQGPLLATAFHPELTGDDRVHRCFVAMVRAAGSDVRGVRGTA